MEAKLICLGFWCKILSIKEIGALVRVRFSAVRVNLLGFFVCPLSHFRFSLI